VALFFLVQPALVAWKALFSIVQTLHLLLLSTQTVPVQGMKQ
jgi:hypothetical protein